MRVNEPIYEQTRLRDLDLLGAIGHTVNYCVHLTLPPFPAPILFGGYLVVQTFGIYRYFCNQWRTKRERIETRSAYLALMPMYAAERDRAYLMECRWDGLKLVPVKKLFSDTFDLFRRARDAERELMKDVEGWEVGTLFGRKPYKTTPEGK